MLFKIIFGNIALQNVLLKKMVKSTLACGLQECLSKQWMGDNFSDFRVVVDDSEYFCHKFILSACSTFFKGLLRTNFKENLEQRVELNDMSKETFEVIINAIYKGVDGLTLDNIISVWQATHMLDVPFLIEECERFVVENMSLENYIKYYDMAKLLHSETVINFTIGFMAKKFEHFRETETFLELSFPILFTIVADDCLNVKSEDLVLESIIKWVSYIKRKPEEMENIDHRDSETVENSLLTTQIDQNNVVPVSQNTNNDTLSLPEFSNCEMSNSASNSDNETLDRKKCLTELLSTARTFLASRSYLDKLLKHPLIMSCVEALEIVHDALLYQWRSVSFPSNFVIPYRNCSGKRNVMAFVKNETLRLFELNSQREIEMGFNFTFEGEMNLQLKCDTYLASTESTLCFYHFISGTWNIAIIDPTKTITNIYKSDYCYNTKLISFNGIFFNLSNGTFQRESQSFNVNVFNIDYGFLLHSRSVCVFQDFILGFSEKSKYGNDPWYSNVNCFNFYTKSVHEVVIKGPSNNIISIQKGRHMFILQSTGFLSSVCTTEDTKIQFNFIINLWENFEWSLIKGAVYYKNELILFCSEKHPDVDTCLLKSVPGVFERIRVVELETQSNVVPLVVPVSWITHNEK